MDASTVIAPIRSAAESFTPLANNEIAQYLCLYKPDKIHITHADYGNGELRAAFRLYDPDLHITSTKHLTRVQIVHYLGQAAYVLGGCLAKEGKLRPLDDADYAARVQTERATFRQLLLKFRQFLPNTDGTKIRIVSHPIRKSGPIFHAPFSFEVNDGACFGTAQAIVQL